MNDEELKAKMKSAMRSVELIMGKESKELNVFLLVTLPTKQLGSSNIPNEILRSQITYFLGTLPTEEKK